MQRSFGAQFLYIPKKYRKGTAHREPADLAWAADDSVILFYLRASSEPLELQVEHNRRQAAGYHRLWSSGKMHYSLRGKNRFRDECFVNYKQLKGLLTVLVVSSKCGVHFSYPLTTGIANAVVIIPELLIRWVSEFGGTIVDLLHIVDIYLDISNDLNPAEESSLDLLKSLVQHYVTKSLESADPDKRYLVGTWSEDYRFFWQYLSCMRLPAAFGGAVQSAKGRKLIAGVFGDLALAEYASLVVGAETAINASEPPAFNKWIVLKIHGRYYSFVVGTVNMNSTNVQEATQAVIDACNNGADELESIGFQYGNVLDTNDFRSPLFVSLPQKLPRKHSIVLTEQLIQRSTNHHASLNTN